MTSSKSLLQQLANGEEVAGFNAAFFSRALREAFAEGAAAIAFRESVLHLLSPDSAAVLTPLAEPMQAVVQPQGAAAEVPANHVSTFELESSAGADSTATADLPAHPVQAPTLPVDPEQSDEQASEQHPTADDARAGDGTLGEAPQSAPAAHAADDELPEPMPEQNDDTDEQGWRPSEDAMLLDEYEGLGLEPVEIAERHGRSIADVLKRLRTRHGLDVEIVADGEVADIDSAAQGAQASCPKIEEASSTLRETAHVPETTRVAQAAEVPQAHAAQGYEEVIDEELRRATPDAVTFASGVLKNLLKNPTLAGKLVTYLGEAKAHQKLSERLRLALIEKVKAQPLL